MSNIFAILFCASFFILASCSNTASSKTSLFTPIAKPTPTAEQPKKIKNDGKVIHILVALCDNENQGIVPVPKSLGNGEDPKKNLYWGAAYGVKTFFSRSRSWQKIAEFENPKENVLERVVFKHKINDVYLVADAYRGIKIKETIEDFLAAASGTKLENIKIKNKTLQILGSANIISFVGHNGLMDFDIDEKIVKSDKENRDAIILACASRQYFSKYLKRSSAKPLLWTSNLMAPEAYILHDAIAGWIKGETNTQIQTRAARAYSKYQKISLRSAKRLLVTGW